jgi:hypothetical protein
MTWADAPRALGMTGDGLAGDVDFDGDVDITDLGQLRACFGRICE